LLFNKKSFTVLLADLFFFANTRPNHRFYMTVLCRKKPYLECYK
jgi:hypothetical protein